jgi:hypothetical protein
VALVADLTDTSEHVVRRHYGKYIANFADDLARRDLLEEGPAAANVVALRK